MIKDLERRLRLSAILAYIYEEVKDADSIDLEIWESQIDEMLDIMVGNDFFGTEGQFDPRRGLNK